MRIADRGVGEFLHADIDQHVPLHPRVDRPDQGLAHLGEVEVVEVVGKWDDGTAQKATADAIAIHKTFAGIYVQGGSTGTVRALLDFEGIFAGVSAGAVVHVARTLAAELNEGVVVCVLADAGWKYLSADFWSADDVETSMERTLWW